MTKFKLGQLVKCFYSWLDKDESIGIIIKIMIANRTTLYYTYILNDTRGKEFSSCIYDLYETEMELL
jgi:hypothetical protein